MAAEVAHRAVAVVAAAAGARRLVLWGSNRERSPFHEAVQPELPSHHHADVVARPLLASHGAFVNPRIEIDGDRASLASCTLNGVGNDCHPYHLLNSRESAGLPCIFVS